ncbi:YqgQ family protein [Leuconostocaceae bacterium ESL0958]|nr:YqgQ family protein [Leuconostocaceae bacterium ESL0958]
MKNFYDVLQYLKTYQVYIHLGKRLWDIEFAAMEVDHLYQAQVLSDKDYRRMKIVLAREQQEEAKREARLAR